MKTEEMNPGEMVSDAHAPSGSRINRRKFFKLLGGGIAITFVASDMLSAGIAGIDNLTADDNSIHAWIHVGENNRVTVYTGKVEVGQNIRTSLAQIVAEELKVPLDAIEMRSEEHTSELQSRENLVCRLLLEKKKKKKKVKSSQQETNNK